MNSAGSNCNTRGRISPDTFVHSHKVTIAHLFLVRPAITK